VSIKPRDSTEAIVPHGDIMERFGVQEANLTNGIQRDIQKAQTMSSELIP